MLGPPFRRSGYAPAILCVGFIQTPGPGERKGGNSAGAERNWDISVANLGAPSAAPPNLGSSTPCPHMKLTATHTAYAWLLRAES